MAHKQWFMQYDWIIIYCFIVILVLLTWLIFFQWEWIIKKYEWAIRNWYPVKSKANFVRLVPEIEEVMRILQHHISSNEKKISQETLIKLALFARRLEHMGLHPGVDESKPVEEEAKRLMQILSQMLEYAKAGRYKEYVDLHKKL